MSNTHKYELKGGPRLSVTIGTRGLMLCICNRKLAVVVVWIICCPIVILAYWRLKLAAQITQRQFGLFLFCC